MQVEEIFIWGKNEGKNRRISILDDYQSTSWVILMYVIIGPEKPQGECPIRAITITITIITIRPQVA